MRLQTRAAPTPNTSAPEIGIAVPAIANPVADSGPFSYPHDEAAGSPAALDATHPAYPSFSERKSAVTQDIGQRPSSIEYDLGHVSRVHTNEKASADSAGSLPGSGGTTGSMRKGAANILSPPHIESGCRRSLNGS